MRPKLFSGGKKASKKLVTTYDIIVIGSGSGMMCVENAMNAGMSVALVDRGPAGGTCLNVGCIPSKMLMAAADRVMEIRDAAKYGISAEITHIDFGRIMADMKEAVVPDHQNIHEGLKAEQGMAYYEGTGRFVDDKTLAVDNRLISGKTIFIVSGARPAVPPIAGLEEIDYLTNETLLDLTACPKSLAIIGGGYIAAEYGHFFSAMGAEVSIFQNKDRLVPSEEPEVSDLLANALSRRADIHLNANVTRVYPSEKGVTVESIHNNTGRKIEKTVDRILIAAGRQSNADILEVDKTGIETDERGYIKVDDYLQTSRKGIWAFGDANGKHMFTHVANAEAETAWANAVNGEKNPFDYSAAPRAVFTYPPVASVGMTEAAARKSHDVMVGLAPYNACAKGMALRETEGFAKIILNRKDATLLGFHIIGPHAPILIQEVVNAMALGGQPGMVISGMHIHPALSELILKTFSNLS